MDAKYDMDVYDEHYRRSSINVIDLLKISNTLQEGHFVLTSGLHSNKYFQCAKLLQYPDMTQRICSDIVKYFYPNIIDTVLSPALGGIIAGYEVARQIGIRNIFAERKNYDLELRRGFDIKQGERVLIIEDVITTGGSVFELLDIVKEHGGKTVGIGCIINRASSFINFGIEFFWAYKADVQKFKPSDCELCKKHIPITQK